MSESTEATHDGVDEFVYDPIRVSLLATIDDENTAYRDLDKVDRYSLFEAKTIDIWESNSRGAEIVDRSYPLSRHLPEELFEVYHPSVPRGGRLALRLLCTRPVLSGNQTARHDDLSRPDERQINYLPFIPSEVQDLIHQWDLPREFTWMRLNAREVGNFQRKTVWDFDVKPPQAIRMGMPSQNSLPLPFEMRFLKQLENPFLYPARQSLLWPFQLSSTSYRLPRTAAYSSASMSAVRPRQSPSFLSRFDSRVFTPRLFV
jgi:hypothetical protein